MSRVIPDKAGLTEQELSAITRGPLKSVAELIDVADLWNNSIGYQWAFRGQPRPYSALIPSFQRQFTIHSFGTAKIIEDRLIKAFREHYAALHDLGADMPKPERLREGFDLRCLSVMQHYEIPTRLLDWTANCWAATYFASASDPTEHAELWVYDRRIFESQRALRPELNALIGNSELNEPLFLGVAGPHAIVELDPRISPRMREQLAHHTVSSNVFADHARLLFDLIRGLGFDENPPTDGIPLDADQLPFVRFLIDSSCKGKILQFLAEEKNITASTVFPDVVGLGRFLRWQFDSLRTMLF